MKNKSTKTEMANLLFRLNLLSSILLKASEKDLKRLPWNLISAQLTDLEDTFDNAMMFDK